MTMLAVHPSISEMDLKLSISPLILGTRRVRCSVDRWDAQRGQNTVSLVTLSIWQPG